MPLCLTGEAGRKSRMNVLLQIRTPRPPSACRTLPFLSARARRALLLVAAAPMLALVGCSEQDPNAFAPACAQVGILAAAADYSDYGGSESSPDLSRLVSQGSVTAVTGHCSSALGGTALHTVVQLQFAITRGPVGSDRTIPIPYFIAVTQDGTIISKQELTAVAQFPDNGDKVLVKTDPTVLEFPVTQAKPSTSYKIEVGFQLNARQLDYNRSHLPR